jgi:serine/threonine protein kinase
VINWADGYSDKIVRLLGQGTFGKVVEARNIETRKKVAIKVIRAIAKYRDASKIEIRVLETLKKNDPNNFKWVTTSREENIADVM